MGAWASWWSVTLYLVDTIATTVFDQSLSNLRKVKVNFGTLCIRPCGHDTDYRFSPITFRLHMQVLDDERRNHIDFRSRSQRSMSTLALYV